MFFFNDECDFRDDDQYDFFTLATQIERRGPSVLHHSLPTDEESTYVATTKA